MLDLLTSSAVTTNITIATMLECTLVSLVLGAACAGIHMYRNPRYSKNFIVTLALLPAIVEMIILLVNGNLGTGVAVAGAFSLVRFRSLPGSSREIGSLFLAMAVGLATGTGYLVLAALFVVILGAATLLFMAMPFGEQATPEKDLKITVPETLEYEGAFDDIFASYTATCALIGVKTTNMGSLYELHYKVALKPGRSAKQFLDELRCRNGNLTIQLNSPVTREDAL